MRNYYPRYLDTEVYKRVVSVARSYENDKHSITAIENDIIHSSPTHEGGRSGLSKPVEQQTEKIEKHTRLLQHRTTSVEVTLQKFPIHEQEFIRQNLISGIPIRYCCVMFPL